MLSVPLRLADMPGLQAMHPVNGDKMTNHRSHQSRFLPVYCLASHALKTHLYINFSCGDIISNPSGKNHRKCRWAAQVEVEPKARLSKDREMRQGQAIYNSLIFLPPTPTPFIFDI